MRVVLLGDSHLARVRRDLPRIGDDVVNAAVGGARAGHLLAQALGAGLGPGDVGVVSVGTNDARLAAPVAAFEASLSEVLRTCAPAGWVYVVPPGVHDARATPRSSVAVAILSAAARRVLGAHGAAVVDTPALLAPLGGRAFTDDGVHLTGAAYDVLLPAIAVALS